MAERMISLKLDEKELALLKEVDAKAKLWQINASSIGHFRGWKVDLTEKELNMYIKLLKDRASTLYINSSGSYDTSLEAGLIGAMMRCLYVS